MYRVSTTVALSWNLIPRFCQWCIAGGLLGIGFLVPMLWLGVVPGIVMFLFLCSKSTHLRSAIWGGIVTWSIKSLCAVVWFWYVFPFNAWLSVGGWWGEVLIVSVSWLVSGIALGMGGALCAGLMWTLYNRLRLPLWLLAPLLPALWVVAEMTGSFVFSLVTSGPGSFLQSYFSFGYIGYLFGLSELGVLLSGVAGVYGLTFLLVGICTVTYFCPKTRWYIPFGVFILLLGVLQYTSVAQHVFYPRSLQNITVAVIDTKFAAEKVLAEGGLEVKKTALDQAVEAALVLNPDFVLLPEDSQYLNLVYARPTIKQSFAMYQFSHSTSSSVIVDSGRTELETGTLVERARLFSGTAGYLHEFDKQYLVPQGEFIPYVFRLMLKLSGAALSVLSQPSVGRFEPGPLKQVGNIDSSVPGILFCFESARPDGATALINDRNEPTFIVHPVSHAWFHNPKLLWVQLEVMLRIQARMAQVPIVSSGNMTTGRTYFPDGTVVTEAIVTEGPNWSVRLVAL